MNKSAGFWSIRNWANLIARPGASSRSSRITSGAWDRMACNWCSPIASNGTATSSSTASGRSGPLSTWRTISRNWESVLTSAARGTPAALTLARPSARGSYASLLDQPDDFEQRATGPAVVAGRHEADEDRADVVVPLGAVRDEDLREVGERRAGVRLVVLVVTLDV